MAKAYEALQMIDKCMESLHKALEIDIDNSEVGDLLYQVTKSQLSNLLNIPLEMIRKEISLEKIDQKVKNLLINFK